jgi:hypothetical protein
MLQSIPLMFLSRRAFFNAASLYRLFAAASPRQKLLCCLSVRQAKGSSTIKAASYYPPHSTIQPLSLDNDQNNNQQKTNCQNIRTTAVQIQKLAKNYFQDVAVDYFANVRNLSFFPPQCYYYESQCYCCY